MYYSLEVGKIPKYEYNADGTIKYVSIDGVNVPVETGEEVIGYALPVEFKGNIAMSGGDSFQAEFGVDISSYDAILVVGKDSIPITETSLIWHNTEPTYKDADRTIVDPNSADYRVIAIKPSLNVLKAVLGRIVK